MWEGNTLIGEYCQGEYRWYIYEPGSNKPLALISRGQLYFYQLDQLGTPLSLTDSDNNIVWQAHYSVFGKATLTVNKVDNPIRFQGQYYDSESGLHYNHFRYYDPQTGRFISQDPIGLLGGINHYQYAPNHINWIDPLGLCAKENEHKYVLIGEGQAAVELYAQLMRDKYPSMEFRTIGKDWKSIVKKSGANREQLGSAEWERKAVSGNVEWIKDMHKENYTFIDLGEDSSSNRSSFYLAEKETLKEINAKVLKANKKNIDIARNNAKPSRRPPSKIL